MKIKVGNTWHECKPGQPIMIEIDDDDKRFISQLPADSTKLAYFDPKDNLSEEQKLEWMYK